MLPSRKQVTRGKELYYFIYKSYIINNISSFKTYTIICLCNIALKNQLSGPRSYCHTYNTTVIKYIQQQIQQL